MKTVDLLILNGVVITMEGPGTGIINRGAVAIQGSDIVAVGRTEDIRKEYDGHRVIDASDKVVMPGLVDCHTHSADAIVRGLAQDVDNWLYNAYFPLGSYVDEEGCRLGSMVHLAESLLNGTTTISDMGGNASIVLENHIRLGDRCVISEMIHEMPHDIYRYDPMDVFPFDHSVGEARFQECRKLAEQYHGYEGRITCMVGPQAVNMVSLEFMDELYHYARSNHLDIHIHVSQSIRENVQMEKRYGKRAVPLLKEHGWLGPDVLSAHISHARPEEVRMAAEAGCRMVLCTNSMALINGILPPASEYREMGGIVGLGSDQAPGNNRNNMFQEMKNTALLNKVKAGNGTAFPAWQVLRMGTIDGARALGLEDQIGSLRPGKKADIILVDLLRPELTPVFLDPIRNIVPNLVYSADGSEVDTVIVNGRILAEGHRLLHIDLDSLIRQANRKAKEIAAQLAVSDRLTNLPLAQWTRQELY